MLNAAVLVYCIAINGTFTLAAVHALLPLPKFAKGKKDQANKNKERRLWGKIPDLGRLNSSSPEPEVTYFGVHFPGLTYFGVNEAKWHRDLAVVEREDCSLIRSSSCSS